MALACYCVSGCFDNFCCDDDGTFEQIQVQVNAIGFNTSAPPACVDGKFVINSIPILPYAAGGDGCWRTCTLPAIAGTVDGEFIPGISHYEITVIIGSKAVISRAKFILNADVDYSTVVDAEGCVPLCAVLTDTPTLPPSSPFCQAVHLCETPWVGTPGFGIQISGSDNPAGAAGNGHAPAIAVKIDPASTAPVTLSAAGLRVDCCPEQVWAGVNGNGVAITAGGTAGHAPTISLVLDPDLTNIATVGPAGLYVPPELPNVSGLSGNLLTTGPDGGAFVDCAGLAACITSTETALVVTLNGGALGVTQSGVNGHTVNLTTLSANAGNLLTAGTDGGLFLGCAALSGCSIDALADVVTTGANAPSAGQVLGWDGANWIPVVRFQCADLNTCSIDALADVVTTGANAPTTGQALVWNGSNWTPAPRFLCTDLAACALDALGNVDTTGQSAGDVLTFNGSQWIAADPCVGLAACSITNLGDVDTTTIPPAPGDVLEWDGANWIPSAKRWDRVILALCTYGCPGSGAETAPAIFSQGNGTISNIYVTYNGANANGTSLFRLYLNGVATSAVVTIPAGTTGWTTFPVSTSIPVTGVGPHVIQFIDDGGTATTGCPSVVSFDVIGTHE